MREIISLHLGQAGIQIGNACWELFCLEHYIQPDGVVQSDKLLEGLDSNLQTFFQTSQFGKQVPRALFFDDDLETINSIKNCPYRQLFHQSKSTVVKKEVGSIFIPHNLNISEEDEMKDKILKQLEACDGAAGIIIYGSTNGGFSGGISSKLLKHLENDLEKITKTTISIIPSNKSDYNIISPYNSLLTLSKFQQNADCSILIDNDALYTVSERQFDIEYPSYHQINRMIAQMVSSVTQSQRFNGNKFVDLIEMRMNLVAQPQLKYLSASYGPFINIDKQGLESPTLSQISELLFDERGSFYSNSDFKQIQYFASTLFFRGDISSKDLSTTYNQLKESKTIKFADWCPINYQYAISNKSPVPFPNSEQGRSNKAICMIANSTGILESLQNIKNNADKLYAKRAFIHWFVGQGMEEGEIAESLEDLQSSIKNYEEAGIPQEEEAKVDEGQEQNQAEGQGEQENQEEQNPRVEQA